MYKSFYGLSESPFSISPNPKFFYLSTHHREALSMLKHGIAESGGFVLFTGEVGTGKTVILRTLIREMPNNIDKAVIFDPDLSLIEMLETICHEFCIEFEPDSSKRVLVEKISSFLTNNYQKGRRAILMIDEAQHLSDEVIEQVRLLTNIETDNQKLLQVILIGQPELQDKLRQQHMRQIAQRITSRFHLLPLSLNELDSYIRFRMQSAGCVQVVFSAGAVSELYRASNGIPRVINVMADRALLAAFIDKSHIVEAKHMRKAVHDVLGTNDLLTTITQVIKKGPSLGTLIKVSLLCFLMLGMGYLFTTIYFTFISKNESNRSEVIARLRSEPNIKALQEELKGLTDSRTGIEQIKREQSRYSAGVSNNQFEEDSWKSLMRVWGFTTSADNVDIEKDCTTIKSKGFRCLHEKASLDDIQRYNVPVELQLMDKKLTPFYAVLIKLNEKYAVLLMDGREWTVRRDWLESSMEGDFRLIWPLPLGVENINSSSKSEVLLALAKILNNYDGDSSYVFKGWNSALTNKIKGFKKAAGLGTDTNVGVDTMWALLPYTETEHPLYADTILSPAEEKKYLSKLKAEEKANKPTEESSNQNADISSDDLLSSEADDLPNGQGTNKPKADKESSQADANLDINIDEL